MANYSARGRPELPRTKKKGEIIQFRMTPEERKRCEAAAKKTKDKLSAWIRKTLLEAAEKG